MRQGQPVPQDQMALMVRQGLREQQDQELREPLVRRELQASAVQLAPRDSMVWKVP